LDPVEESKRLLEGRLVQIIPLENYSKKPVSLSGRINAWLKLSVSELDDPICNVVSLEAVDSADVSSQLLKALYTDCETVASELFMRLVNVDAYIRLNVESGLEASSLDDWRGLGAIEQTTNAYVETSAVICLLEESLGYLQSRVGTATLAQISAYCRLSKR
jgi:hypothetical protein